MNKVMTVYEVAEILQVHFNTVYELIRKKKIRSIKIGKNIRITEKYLNDFLEGDGLKVVHN